MRSAYSSACTFNQPARVCACPIELGCFLVIDILSYKCWLRRPRQTHIWGPQAKVHGQALRKQLRNRRRCENDGGPPEGVPTSLELVKPPSPPSQHRSPPPPSSAGSAGTRLTSSTSTPPPHPLHLPTPSTSFLLPTIPVPITWHAYEHEPPVVFPSPLPHPPQSPHAASPLQPPPAVTESRPGASAPPTSPAATPAVPCTATNRRNIRSRGHHGRWPARRYLAAAPTRPSMTAAACSTGAAGEHCSEAALHPTVAVRDVQPLGVASATGRAVRRAHQKPPCTTCGQPAVPAVPDRSDGPAGGGVAACAALPPHAGAVTRGTRRRPPRPRPLDPPSSHQGTRRQRGRGILPISLAAALARCRPRIHTGAPRVHILVWGKGGASVTPPPASPCRAQAHARARAWRSATADTSPGHHWSPPRAPCPSPSALLAAAANASVEAAVPPLATADGPWSSAAAATTASRTSTAHGTARRLHQSIRCSPPITHRPRAADGLDWHALRGGRRCHSPAVATICSGATARGGAGDTDGDKRKPGKGPARRAQKPYGRRARADRGATAFRVSGSGGRRGRQRHGRRHLRGNVSSGGGRRLSARSPPPPRP